jgi:regulatory protein
MNSQTSNTSDEADAAWLRSLYFLKFRPRSRYEIEKYLKGKNFSFDAVVSAIHRLEAAGFLNDDEFARLWVENRLRCKPKGIAALRAELRAKGISEEIIGSVIAGMDEKQAAWDAIQPKLRRWHALDKEEFKKKVAGCLTRRGFHYGLCREIIEKAWGDINSSSF